jgi:uncharacterized membrane protein
MRAALGLVAGLLSACGASSETLSVSDHKPGDPVAPSATAAHGGGAAPDGSTSGSTEGMGADAGESAPAYTPAFHVIEAFAEGVVPGQLGPVEFLPFVTLFDGGPDALFGVTGGLTGEKRPAAQVFRWVPGGEAQLLDDFTPWKALLFADPSGRWVVGERGAGLGSAQAFVWTLAGGFVELTITGRVPVIARGVSRDGGVIVGDVHGGVGWHSYRWTATEGAQNIPLPAGYLRATSVSISADGSSVFGTMEKDSGRWQCFRSVSAATAEALELPTTLEGRELVACGLRQVAADGSAATGSATYINPDDEGDRRITAFHWSGGSGTRWIETPAGFVDSTAFEISGDGLVVYGQLNVDANSSPGDQPFRWTAESGTVPLGLLDGVRNAALLAVGVRPRPDMSEDGHTVVGNGVSGEGQGFLWSVSRGLVALKPLPGHTETEVTHLGASGRVAAGLSRGAEVEAVLWDETGEPRAIRTLLAQASIDIGDFDFDNGNFDDVAVFDNGKRIIGNGKTAEGVSAGWTALLP